VARKTDAGNLGCLIIAAALAACASDQSFLDGPQPAAVQAALSRAKFELSCSDPSPEVLSRDIVQPEAALPRFGGFPRAEYTIGVSGCGQKATYVVVCSDETDCFAGEGRR
jgi:hypothetical protein